MAVILASQSPRRRELLERMGISDFLIRPAQGEELFDPSLTPAQLVEALSRQKAEEISAGAGPEDIVIAADTVVSVDGRVLGKPRDGAEAAEMLAALSGREHTVYTGVTVRRGGETVTEHEATAVRFRPLTGEEIAALLYETRYDSSIYITVDTLKYLKKGGRVTPAAAALGTLLRIKPVLTIQGEKLDAFAKARTVKQGKSIMIKQVVDDCRDRFGSEKGENIHISIAYTYDVDAAEIFKKEVQEVFPDHDIVMQPLSLSIACHIGPGALALTATKAITV